MKRIVIIALLCTLLVSGQVFAQYVDLPEPVYAGFSDAAEVSFVYLPAAEAIHLPDFADVAYLWAFHPGNAAEDVDFTSIAVLAAAGSTDANSGIIPSRIRNNEYFLESVRLKDLAETAYDSGDYDASASYAAESLRYAQRSDEYVALQLKIKEADDAIAQARTRLAWAGSNGFDKMYPNEFAQAQALYTQATNARANEDWDGAIAAARRILAMLAGAEDMLLAGKVQDPLPPSPVLLPSQYTVRTWQGEKDCYWNIAGYSWVYGDPRKWKLLYEANKAKMPDPNNPNLIEPGMIMDIPSINNEARQGMWQSGRSYPGL